jgi:hypothetical protein
VASKAEAIFDPMRRLPPNTITLLPESLLLIYFLVILLAITINIRRKSTKDFISGR